MNSILQKLFQVHAIFLFQQRLPQIADFLESRRDISHREILDAHAALNFSPK